MENLGHSKIAIIIGTKAELIKTFPIMLELQEQGRDYWFIHTGQHPIKMACEEFGVKKPDYILSKEPERNTKFWSKVNRSSLFWSLSMILKIKNLIKKISPKYIIYHGDTMSTAVASIASSRFLNINKVWKNVHLEAGLRSGSLFEPFPEEISRQISDKFSDILLAVSDRTEKNLDNYKRKKDVIKIGNTIIDSAHISYNKSKKMKYEKQRIPYALINIHRHENINNKERLERIVEIIKNIKIRAIWPLHDNTAYFLKKYGLMNDIKNKENIQITPLVDYFNFISLLSSPKCEYLLADGGSIQEESLVFKKPCIILRKKTERQEGLTTGINFLTNLNVNYAKEIINKIEGNKLKFKKFENPYGNKGVSKKILKILK